MDQSSDNIRQILDNLSNLNSRISRIESFLNLSGDENITVEPHKKTEEEKQSLEFEIGQFWFAKAGIVVLALGIALILTLPFRTLPQFMPSLFGYIISIVLFGFSRLWKNSLNLISRYLFASAFLLLFFSTLRLHYWSNPSVIDNNILEFIFLAVISLALLIISIRRESTYLYNIGLTLGFTASLVSGDPYIIFISILSLTALTSYIKIKYEWATLFYYSIVLAYLTHFIWFINNPLVIGNKIELINEPYVNIFFLMSYLITIAVGNIFRNIECKDERQKVISSFFNSFGFLFLFAIITVTQFRSEITTSFIVASILFLSLSTLFWKKGQDKYSVFFFSILGYSTLSIAIINSFEIPELFIWLSWQSILVVTTAIWFRSKIIIIANFFIYALIAIATMSFSGNHAISCMNAGIVALLSARILNSQKDKLEIKTEAIRNAYLGIAFILLPYSTFLLVPLEYVGLTWLAIALLYYAFSLILKNKKYRWMAMLTLAITILYTIVLGIMHPEDELKVISFIIVGLVLIIISIVYTKIKLKNSIEKKE
ncbi:hypothetical protein MNBD_IGNAVI01-94 [hydrothermal vent metagenome]|uniref:DUF2339 domain-containing protein n=1 Tax=hydrothermal vent metagenome TaxID=652676 RepID=A0A3B1CIC9_9ZZZZ